jgi:hypothetical protein
MFCKEMAERIDKVALEEIAIYGLPTMLHYSLSQEKGADLAKRLNADINLVRAGVALMDIKLGQASKEGYQQQHVKYCVEYSEQLLKELNIEEPFYSILVNCVAAHHGEISFQSIEAEIVANADCYRFIHPRGVMSFHATVVKRGNEHDSALKLVENKMDEKFNILSLDVVKDELVEYYRMFKKILNTAKTE